MVARAVVGSLLQQNTTYMLLSRGEVTPE